MKNLCTFFPQWVIHFDSNSQNFGNTVPQEPGFVKRQPTGSFTTVAAHKADTHCYLAAAFHAHSLRGHYQGSKVRLEKAHNPKSPLTI